MTSTIWSVDADTTLRQAAGLMAKLDVGVLPVLAGNHLLGIVTDRDIAIRGTAAALLPDAPVSAVMSRGVHACHADEDVAEVLLDMELLQIRRMPVEDDKDELVGMVSLSDLVAAASNEDVGRTFKNICAARNRVAENEPADTAMLEDLSLVA
jgi:CBS domain-containing protein